MTVTYTITHWGIEGNRRKNRGQFTMTSAEVIAYVDTGLRVVEHFEIAAPISGYTVNPIYPTTYPEYNNLSGVVTVAFTSTAGPIMWKAEGKT